VTRRPALPPVDVYRLISDGIEGPLRGGFMRGIKHLDCNLSQEQIEWVLEQQHSYLMDWMTETFRFPEGR
jgi:hypothetical protein